MAYAHGVFRFLYVGNQKIHRQGMLSKRFEWNAMEIDVDPNVVKQDAFRQIVDDS